MAFLHLPVVSRLQPLMRILRNIIQHQPTSTNLCFPHMFFSSKPFDSRQHGMFCAVLNPSFVSRAAELVASDLRLFTVFYLHPMSSVLVAASAEPVCFLTAVYFAIALLDY
jgi:hypothetical protein